jgi:glucose-1-phosphate adenylyltransferase
LRPEEIVSSVQAFVLAGGRGDRLGVITKHRSKAAVPFGGRYRIIDFTLSNCVNSRIHSVYVAAQYAPRSLQEHVRLGRPWDLDRRDGGLTLLQPYAGRTESHWYRGTAEALYRNLDIITSHGADMTLVLSGDQVYRMNYGEMIRQHRRNRARLTVAVKPAEAADSRRFGMADVDGTRVVRFEEKPADTDMRLANLAIYLFDTRYLVERLHEAVSGGNHDLVLDVVIPAVNQGDVAAYIYEGFWEDVGELDTFYNANRSLLPAASAYLMDRRRPIYTRSEERPPAKFGSSAQVLNSVIANGCRIFGRVERSILFPGVLVGDGAVVRDSILFSGASVYRNAQVRRCIIDKRVLVGDGATLGSESAEEAQLGRAIERDVLVKTREGLTVIGKDTQIPSHFECVRPIMIDSHLDAEGVKHSLEVRSGEPG